MTIYKSMICLCIHGRMLLHMFEWICAFMYMVCPYIHIFTYMCSIGAKWFELYIDAALVDMYICLHICIYFYMFMYMYTQMHSYVGKRCTYRYV